MIGLQSFGVGLAGALRAQTIAVDRSVNALHGVYLGAPDAVSGGGLLDGSTAPVFDGVDDLVLAPDAAALRFTTGIALEARIFPFGFNHTNGGGAPRIISKSNYSLWTTATGIGFGVSAAAPALVTIATAIPTNVWTHIAVVWDGATATFYKNWAPIGSVAMVGVCSVSAAPFLVGDFTNSTTERHWWGLVAHVAAYPWLSPVRIAARQSFRPHANLYVRSGDISHAAWTKTRSAIDAVAGGTTLAPDGTATAWKLRADLTAANSHYLYQNNVAATAGKVHAASIFAKAAEYAFMRIQLQGGDAADGCRADFDLTTGVATLRSNFGAGSAIRAYTENWGGGWFRCVLVGLHSPTVLNADALCILVEASNDITIDGDGVSGIYVWQPQFEEGGAASPIIPTTTAAVTINTYEEEILRDAPAGYWPLGETLAPFSIVDAWALKPIQFEVNGVSWSDSIRMDSLAIDDTLGQPVVCDFTLVNPATKPKTGDRVRAIYYDAVLFSGVVVSVERMPNLNGSVIDYRCSCTDWSILLTKRRLRRNFTDLPLVAIIDSILDNELAGEGLSIGTIDIGSTLPLVDVRNARAFDVFRDVAGATGQAMYVDFDKVVHFRTSTNETAPKLIDDTTVEASKLPEDMETYRNVQTVIVTGTPANTNEDPLTVVIVRENAEQIAARKEAEGGTGRHDHIEEVTHPTSNDSGQLALLGIGYAQRLLATSGTNRKTLSVRVRGYGFRAGQFATVDLPGVGVSGTWLIQRASLREQCARYLVYELELTESSRQLRAYESWLKMIQAGKIVIQLPATVTTNLVSWDTPTVTTWTVPVGVTEIEMTVYGGSGAGAGVFWGFSSISGWSSANGGSGGPSGKAVTIMSVTPGQEFDIIVGAAGVQGSNGLPGNSFGTGATPGTPGTAGTLSQVSLSGLVKAQGGGGGAGGYYPTNTDGAAGSATGDAPSTGGGFNGGAGGTPSAAPLPGHDGLVEIRW